MNNPSPALIFDLDGTLLDTMPLHYQVWVEALAQIGLSFTEQRFYALGGLPTAEIVKLLAEEQSVSVDLEAFVGAKEQLFLKHIKDVKPVAETVAVARRCFGVLPMAVATGGTRRQASALLRAGGLDGLFKVVVGAEDTARHKPFPDVFLLAAARLDVLPEQCIVYEDSDPGLQAGLAAGMEVVDVRRVRAGEADAMLPILRKAPGELFSSLH